MTTFVLVVLLLSADFWMVKNVSGRLLVGLRWWNRVNADTGETEWIYESAPSTAGVAAVDTSIFWGALYAAPLIWAACGVGAFVTLSWDWLLVHAVAAGLTGANLVGYLQCSSEAKKRLENATVAAGALHSALSMPGMASALPILSLFSSALASHSAAQGSSGGGGGGSSSSSSSVGAAQAAGGARGVSDVDAVADPFGVGGGGSKVSI